MREQGVSRRRFMAGSGALLALPTIVSSGCLGLRGSAARRPPPSERINVGMLGYGTMAQDNIGNFLNNDNVQLVSICDVVSEGPLYGYSAERMGGREPGRRKVNAFYAEKTGQAGYSGCKVFTDFRDMLQDKDLDAVCISTPDHWHALCTLWSAKMGKHIYGQKPLYLTVNEGRAMVKGVQKAGITFQTGAQSRSNDYFRMACEFVRNNRIGKLQRVEVGLNKGHATFGKTPEQLSETPLAVPPPYVNFDLWLGPAPKRLFTPKIHHPMQWRYNLDYSCGMLTDFAAHQLDIMQWALNKDGVEPFVGAAGGAGAHRHALGADEPEVGRRARALRQRFGGGPFPCAAHARGMVAERVRRCRRGRGGITSADGAALSGRGGGCDTPPSPARSRTPSGSTPALAA